MLNHVLVTARDYHLYILIGLLILFIILNSRGTRRNKMICFMTTLLAISVGYELITNEPVTNLPRRIDHFFNDKPSPDKSQNIHYYTPHSIETTLPDQ